MSFIDEKEALKSLQQSDVKAFDWIFARYQKQVLSFCYHYTGSKEEAEEIGQTVFLAIWENRFTIDEERSFATYLFSIARHHVYNAIKKKMYRKAFLEKTKDLTLEYDFDTGNQIFFHDLEDLLEKLLTLIPPKRREIFLLSRKEGLSYKQIAETLQISENTVDTQIRNVLNYIRPILEKFL
ncbi:MAG: RNA polymerase sigma-70 factor [Bacteroidota bacterium]|nr:RNA polymerase sigma-70 factor [Bacteroidota bacterium]MDP4225514.1 RNA polymerase sigma-70 factor [Bacteroidota bacterium]MDP4273675.1 RNA polymerase sigma-70 factor [Bacteroidota bacterium]